VNIRGGGIQHCVCVRIATHSSCNRCILSTLSRGVLPPRGRGPPIASLLISNCAAGFRLPHPPPNHWLIELGNNVARYHCSYG